MSSGFRELLPAPRPPAGGHRGGRPPAGWRTPPPAPARAGTGTRGWAGAAPRRSAPPAAARSGRCGRRSSPSTRPSSPVPNVRPITEAKLITCRASSPSRSRRACSALRMAIGTATARGRRAASSPSPLRTTTSRSSRSCTASWTKKGFPPARSTTSCDDLRRQLARRPFRSATRVAASLASARSSISRKRCGNRARARSPSRQAPESRSLR